MRARVHAETAVLGRRVVEVEERCHHGVFLEREVVVVLGFGDLIYMMLHAANELTDKVVIMNNGIKKFGVFKGVYLRFPARLKT